MEASTTMTTAQISKSDFLARMNETCRHAWRMIVKNYETYRQTQSSGSKRERVADAIQLSVLAGIDFHIFDNFRILGAPAGQEDDVEKILGPMQFAVERGQHERKPTAFTVGALAKRFEDYNQRAAQYGLVDCLVNEAHLASIEE